MVAAAFAGPSLFANAASNLPPLTPQELLTKVAEAEPSPLSGTVVYTARLGLPEVPLQGLRNVAPTDLLSGSSTIRVWTDGQERSRLALTNSLSEYSVVRDGAQAWTYSSSDNQAVHYTLSPADQAKYDALTKSGVKPGPAIGDSLPSPSAAADAAIAQAGTDTTITVGSETSIAGRDAYQLGLVPKTDKTLIARVLIAVDAKTFTPLRVQVWSTKDTASPAIELGFTDISFAAPADSVFTFTPPAGATVKNQVVSLPDQSAAPDKSGMADNVKTYGTGWESVVQVNGFSLSDLTKTATRPDQTATAAPNLGSSGGLGGQFDKSGDMSGGLGINLSSLLSQATTTVPEGQLISSSLLTILITDDGRLLAGAVPAETLRTLAS